MIKRNLKIGKYWHVSTKVGLMLTTILFEHIQPNQSILFG